MEPSLTAHYISFVGGGNSSSSTSSNANMLTEHLTEQTSDVEHVCPNSFRSSPVWSFFSTAFRRCHISRNTQGINNKGEGCRILLLLTTLVLAGFLLLIFKCGLLLDPSRSLPSWVRQSVDKTPRLSLVGISVPSSIPISVELQQRAQTGKESWNDHYEEQLETVQPSPFSVVIAGTGVSSARPPLIWMWQENDFTEEFGMFINMYSKSYQTPQEEKVRYAIFKKNVYFIQTQNEQGLSYKLKMNHFGDLTLDEFKLKYLGYRKRSEALRVVPGVYLGVDVSLLDVSEDALPDHIDWRDKGCVNVSWDPWRCVQVC